MLGVTRLLSGSQLSGGFMSDLLGNAAQALESAEHQSRKVWSVLMVLLTRLSMWSRSERIGNRMMLSQLLQI